MSDEKSDPDRFGWSTGQLSIVNEDGTETRIGPISPEDQAMIDKLTAERTQQPTGDRKRPRRHIHIHRK